MIAKVYRFDDMLCMSHGKTEACTVKQIMVENVPGILNVFPAHSTNDKNGTDWWAEHASGKMLSIDAKVRSKDFGKKDVAWKHGQTSSAKVQDGRFLNPSAPTTFCGHGRILAAGA